MNKNYFVYITFLLILCFSVNALTFGNINNIRNITSNSVTFNISQTGTVHEANYTLIFYNSTSNNHVTITNSEYWNLSKSFTLYNLSNNTFYSLYAIFNFSQIDGASVGINPKVNFTTLNNTPVINEISYQDFINSRSSNGINAVTMIIIIAFIVGIFAVFIGLVSKNETLLNYLMYVLIFLAVASALIILFASGII